MMLGESGKVAGLQVGNASLVNFAVWNKSGCDEFADPLRRAFVVFIIVVHFACSSNRYSSLPSSHSKCNSYSPGLTIMV